MEEKESEDALTHSVPVPKADPLQQLTDAVKGLQRDSRWAKWIGAGFIAAAAGFAGNMNASVHDIDNRLVKLEAKFDRHIEWHNGKQGSPTIVAPEPAPPAISEQEAREPAPAPLASEARVSIPRPTDPRGSLLDLRLPPPAAPVCADPKTGKLLECSRSECYDQRAWKPSVAKAIAEKLGVDQVTLCVPAQRSP